LIPGLVRYRLLDLRVGLIELFLVTREEPNLSSVAEGKATYAIKLGLENPVRIGEVFIGEGCEHRADPTWLLGPYQALSRCSSELIERIAHL